MKSNFGPVSYNEIVSPPVASKAPNWRLVASCRYMDQDTSLLDTRAQHEPRPRGEADPCPSAQT